MQLTNPIINRPSALRNRELGRRIFILANGPSILKENLSTLKGEVVIGMNASTKLEKRFDFTSKYYVVSDARFMKMPEKRRWAMEDLTSTTHRVLRSDLRSFDSRELQKQTTYVKPLTRDGFSHNLANGFHYGCTTTMLAIQLAWHLGAHEVYLLGCDLRYFIENPRFYVEDVPQLEDAFTSVQVSNIANAATIFDKDGRKLINCSERSFLRSYLEFKNFESLTNYSGA